MALVIDRFDGACFRSALGIAYGSLGRKDDAIREAKLGVELYPPSKDALIGLPASKISLESTRSSVNGTEASTRLKIY